MINHALFKNVLSIKREAWSKKAVRLNEVLLKLMEYKLNFGRQ